MHSLNSLRDVGIGNNLLGQPLSYGLEQIAVMNAARWFQRREDYQPPQTPSDSPFRRFKVNCLKCDSCKLRVIAEFDGESGEVKVFLFCPKCREREAMPIC
jgi:hypothetical protein